MVRRGHAAAAILAPMLAAGCSAGPGRSLIFGFGVIERRAVESSIPPTGPRARAEHARAAGVLVGDSGAHRGVLIGTAERTTVVAPAEFAGVLEVRSDRRARGAPSAGEP